MNQTPARSQFAAYLRAHRHALLEALQTLGREPLATMLTIAVLAIALALPAALLEGIRHLAVAANALDRPGEVIAYLRPGAASAPIVENIRADPRVATVDLRPPEQAFAALSRELAFADASALLDEMELPAEVRIVVREPARNADALADYAATLGAIDGIELVSYDRRWVERVEQILTIARRAIGVLGALLGLSVLLVIGNTIRLEINERVEAIEIAKLIGATDAYVRRPFLYAGALLGLLGGLTACVLTFAALWLLDAPAQALAASYGVEYRLGGLRLNSIAAILGLAIGLGWLGAGIAAGRHIDRVHPR